jgi:hypothetical protein
MLDIKFFTGAFDDCGAQFDKVEGRWIAGAVFYNQSIVVTPCMHLNTLWRDKVIEALKNVGVPSESIIVTCIAKAGSYDLGMWAVEVEFDNEADEAEFIMKVS